VTLQQHLIRARPLLATAVVFLCTAALSVQQQISISGRVVDDTETAVSAQTVVLHRVTPDGGTLLAEAITDDGGRFTLRAEGEASQGAVYFVASRFRGRLYIGPMLRAPFPDTVDYVLQVGVAANALGDIAPTQNPPSMNPGAAAGTPRRWLLLLIPLGGLMALAVWGITHSMGPHEERRLLIRVARLDNKWADSPDPRVQDDYRRRRRMLMDRLGAAD